MLFLSQNICDLYEAKITLCDIDEMLSINLSKLLICNHGRRRCSSTTIEMNINLNTLNPITGVGKVVENIRSKIQKSNMVMNH